MLKKLAIAGSVVLLIGAAVLGWVLSVGDNERREAAACRLKYGSEPDEYLKRYNEWLAMSPKERSVLPWELKANGRDKTQDELRQEQKGRLKGDMDRLAAGEISGHPFTDILYGDNWQDEVREYKKRKQRSEFVLTGSVVCMSAGGLALASCLLVWATRLATAGVSRLKTASDDVRTGDEPTEPGPDPTNVGQNKDDAERSRPSFVQAARSSSHSPGGAPLPLTADSDGAVKQHKKIPVLISGQKAPGYQKSSAASGQNQGVSGMRQSAPTRKVAVAVLAEQQEGPPAHDESLRAKTKDLEKQMDEFRQMAQNVQQAALEHSKPLNGTLQEPLLS